MNTENQNYEQGAQEGAALGDSALHMLREGRTQEEMERIMIAAFRQKLAAAKHHPLADQPIANPIPTSEIIAGFEGKRADLEAGRIAPNWRYTEDS